MWRRQVAPATAAACVIATGPALAHAPDDAMATHLDMWVATPLALVGALFLLGLRRAGRRPAASRAVSFAAGWAVLVAVLLGPIERLAHESLAWHMAQHMLLLTVAPPLLLWSRPLPILLQALPQALRRRLAPSLAAIYTGAARRAVLAFLVHGAVIWLWHLPVLYEAALAYAPLHHLEHASFLLSALWFWWALIAHVEPGRADFGIASILAALTVLHTGMLGALLTFAPIPLYPAHPADAGGLDPLQDQQLAGLIMWVPGGIVYVAAALVLWLKWLSRAAERKACTIGPGRVECPGNLDRGEQR